MQTLLFVSTEKQTFGFPPALKANLEVPVSCKFIQHGLSTVLNKNICVRQGKQAHLHKYSVKHTLVASGGGCGESETSPTTHLSSQ